eukprot:6168339-Prymnesium_polylepis.1
MDAPRGLLRERAQKGLRQRAEATAQHASVASFPHRTARRRCKLPTPHSTQALQASHDVAAEAAGHAAAGASGVPSAERKPGARARQRRRPS